MAAWAEPLSPTPSSCVRYVVPGDFFSVGTTERRSKRAAVLVTPTGFPDRSAFHHDCPRSRSCAIPAAMKWSILVAVMLLAGGVIAEAQAKKVPRRPHPYHRK